MFKGPKCLTRGVENSLPRWLIHLLWHMVLTPETEQDFLQIFRLTRTERGQQIIHEQEQPPYKRELTVPCEDAVDAEIYVIDDGTVSTMLLAEEY